MNITEIKSKLAKLLRLSESSNANEAAAAITKFESLCVQHGVAKADISADFDPEKDEVIELPFGKLFRKRDVAVITVVGAVAHYYNGRTITTCPKNNQTYRVLQVIASKANQIQIELYAEFLLETMERISTKAKKDNLDAPRGFRQNFRKGFAQTIAERLFEMKKQQESQELSEAGKPGLVIMEHNKREQKNALAFLNDKYPHRKSGGRSRLGYGYHEGKDAAQGVGLQKQTEGKTSPTLALTGS